jgi:transcriptional regulator with XRE-family HTH domain
MTQPSYSKIETGETDISYGKLEKIAKVLEICPKELRQKKNRNKIIRNCFISGFLSGYLAVAPRYMHINV